jgi:hypothetical protein
LESKKILLASGGDRRGQINFRREVESEVVSWGDCRLEVSIPSGSKHYSYRSVYFERGRGEHRDLEVSCNDGSDLEVSSLGVNVLERGVLSGYLETGSGDVKESGHDHSFDLNHYLSSCDGGQEKREET